MAKPIDRISISVTLRLELLNDEVKRVVAESCEREGCKFAFTEPDVDRDSISFFVFGNFRGASRVLSDAIRVFGNGEM